MRVRRLVASLAGLCVLAVPAAAAGDAGDGGAAAARSGAAPAAADGGTSAMPSSQAAASLLGLFAEADAAYRHRDEPGQLGLVRDRLAEAEKLAPDDYGVLWRLARLWFWVSDDPKVAADDRSRIGKRAWDYGDRASRANPAGVEGWFFAASGVGNYSLGIGILKAFSQGLEGKFKDRLSQAEKIDPNYLDGGIYNAWGRFYYELPGFPIFKYDPGKSEQNLKKAIEVNPDNVRARVYLADLYLKEDRRADAKAVLEQALAHEPGAYDAPEERRYQARARAILATMEKK